jgi:hypothetical protein
MAAFVATVLNAITPYVPLARECNNKCRINPKIELVPYSDLPRAEFKSKRILDLREKAV